MIVSENKKFSSDGSDAVVIQVMCFVLPVDISWKRNVIVGTAFDKTKALKTSHRFCVYFRQRGGKLI